MVWSSLVCGLGLLALASAAPQRFSSSQPLTRVIADERNIDDFGNYQFRYETDDGTFHEARGQPQGQESYAVEGSYSFISPEGETVVVSYFADENGFRAESPYIPTTPPPPPHALAQIRAAEEAFARQRSSPSQQSFVQSSSQNFRPVQTAPRPQSRNFRPRSNFRG